MIKVHTRLRTHRRSWALTQRELASLLGIRSAQHVSRVERGVANPSVRFVVGAEIVFGNFTKETFPHLFDEIEEEVVRNLYVLKEKLGNDKSKSAERKRELVDEALHRAIMRSKSNKEI